MMEAFTAYIKTITALTIFSAMAEILMPEGDTRKYAELVLGVLLLIAVLSPFLRLFGVKEGDISLSPLRQSIRFEQALRTEDEYREIEKERLEHTYQAMLEEELLRDLQKKYPEIEWVEADFCRDAENGAYGELQSFSVGCGGADTEEVQKYAAKRYHLPEGGVLAVN